MHVPQTEVILRHDDVELARVTLPPGEYVIGRSDEAEICAETPLISRQHARLVIHHDHLTLEDLGSSNGTFVAEQRISEVTRLFPNQHVRLGDVVLEVHRDRATTHADHELAPAQAAIRRVLPDELLAEKRYAIGAQVARGGMGAIMMARQQTTQRNVAMKVMLEMGDEGDVLRFIEEAQITSQLEHPNIVPIYELGVDEQSQLFYTMKFVRGITLKKVLELLMAGIPETIAKYPLSALLTIFQKACDALAFAHSRSVIHRDLKPENLMLGDFGEVLVMDWGLAKVIGESARPAGERRSAITSHRMHGDSTRTLMGAIMGTPQYMSPEQARGEVDELDARSDVYALGTILFEMIYLRASVTGESAQEAVDKVARGAVEWTQPGSSTTKKMSGRIPLLPHIPGGRVPDSLVAVCRKALALDPERRYASVTDLQLDLTAYQTGFATTAEKAGAWKQFRLLVRRNRGVSVAISAALVIVAAVTGIFTFNVIRERNRAETSLHELRGTAPTFAAQARALVEEGKIDEALEKIAYATQLDPQNTDYLLQRANALEIALHLHDASAAYRQVLVARPGDASARQNLDLCNKLLAENGGKDELAQPLIVKLVDALLAQGRQIDANPLAQRVGKGTATGEATLRARLKELTAQPGWTSGRLHVQPNGTLSLGLNGLHVSNLNALTGFPISALDVDDPNFSDVTPLAGLPLIHLGLFGTSVSDLSPLKGMPIEVLNLTRTRVTDFSVLQTMKLRDLSISQLDLPTLQAFAGLKLERLDIWGSKVTDIGALHGMPLHDLSMGNNHVADYSPLNGLPLETLSINSNDLAAIPPLAGFPLRQLNASNNRISDLRPLAGLKITNLNLATNPLGDLDPLRSLPLQILDIGTEMRGVDLAPLADIKTLEDITLPRFFLHEEVLRTLPKLRRARIPPMQSYMLPMKQFWTELKPEWIGVAHTRAIVQTSGLKLQNGSPVQTDPGGTLYVDLSRGEGGPIPPLGGLPISRLNCDGSAFTDLGPLRNLPLTRVSFGGTKVSDISPLQGMPLVAANFGGTLISDLSPLQGAPLQLLNVNGTHVKDFSILRGKPLEELYLSSLNLTDVSFLRGLPLRKLELSNNPITDLSPIAGMKIENLILSGSSAADLTALRGMPLQYLNISRTQVRDLSPLRGSPITEMTLEYTPVQDFSPLLDLPKLEKLRLGGNPQQISVLRKHPSLKLIVQGQNGPYIPVEKFWADLDARQGKAP